ncbi:P-loop containing nucleoside triphosphate hydrolase protein [Kockovaella imperatae]|uniref:p-loop containing nucleoside triphosphate hydrolase protein n=1 Tax=Kockovaella imperatae TaxID=4999 RepID=A0A1Y1UFG1_9TREE|nr:P-loop containing nucleoside triphosphate hydrolase protein [Kockovaella imperatae]ORX36768.1 P-loop containing nucleoside triphosphate hydrolase protein [Kockovaella imperatae]
MPLTERSAERDRASRGIGQITMPSNPYGVRMSSSRTLGGDDDLERLAQKVVARYHDTPPDKRLLVSVAGIPGSGKSTLAYPLTDRINALISGHAPLHPSHLRPDEHIASPDKKAGTGSDEVAICVGLDGWHLTREKLDTFHDPKDAHWRRGAPFTFDLSSYLTFLLHLRQPLQPNPPVGIPFPTFDHALKDPRPSPVPILPRHRIVVLEGLYTHLAIPGWKDCAEMYDIRVWVDVDPSIARGRVIERNFRAGIVNDLDRCAERVDAVDMENAKLILENRIEATDEVHPEDVPGNQDP